MMLLVVVMQAKMRFVELVYVLVTEEAERIGVDHVARVSAGDSTEGSMGKCFLSPTSSPFYKHTTSPSCPWHTGNIFSS